MRINGRKSVSVLVAIGMAALLSIFSPPMASAGLFGGGTSIATAKSMIRELVYGYSQNCSISYTSCIQFVIKNGYPKYLNPTKARVCANNQPPYTSTALVDLDSVAPDKNWTLQPPIYQDENKKLFGVPLKGDTFIATVTFANTDGYGITTPQKSDLHFTILNKKIYFYFDVCTK